MPILIGRCACGAVSYEANADPIRMINCHCRHCQQATGSAFAALIALPSNATTLLGILSRFMEKSERGTEMERGFCPKCGSPVTFRPLSRPDVLFVYAASLDDPTQYKADADIWVRSAQPWDHFNPEIPSYETRMPNIFG